MKAEARVVVMAAAVAAVLAGPPAARAQVSDLRCGEDQSPTLDIGIAAVRFTSANLQHTDGRLIWRFSDEPSIRAVRPGGPAEGRLEPGDQIVSIDGLLITSVEGGRRFSGLEVGRTTTLVVRRGGREREVQIGGSLRCHPLPWQWPARADRADRPYTILTPTVAGDSGWMYDAPGLRARLRAPRTDNDAFVRLRLQESPGRTLRLARVPARLRVLFGFGVYCTDCAFESDSSGVPVSWRFSSSPSVSDVERDGPAARGGLRRGDVIEAVEGAPITSEEGARLFSSAQPGRPLRFTVRRNGRSLTVDIVPRAPAAVRPR